MRLFKAHRLSMLLFGGLAACALFFGFNAKPAYAALSDFKWEYVSEGGKSKIIATPKAKPNGGRAAEWVGGEAMRGGTLLYGPMVYKHTDDKYRQELKVGIGDSFIKVQPDNRTVGYITTNLTGGPTDGIKINSITGRPTAPADDAEPQEDTNDEAEQDSCDVQVNNPLSWVICPVLQLAEGAVNMFATRANDALCFEIAKNKTTSNDCDDGKSAKDQPPKDSETPLYEAWSNMRNIANVLFVVALLAIVISQLVIGKM
jgi:hypothetical protein